MGFNIIVIQVGSGKEMEPILQVNRQRLEEQVAENEALMNERAAVEEKIFREQKSVGANFILKAECTTSPTEFDGARHPCWSQWLEVTAPDGYAINENDLNQEWIHKRGSRNLAELIPENDVEVIPGLMFPKTLKLRVFALSPKGMGTFGRRGKSIYMVSGVFIKLPSE